MEMIKEILDPSRLVLLAGALITVAMLFRNQIILRCIYLSGSALYITYYVAIVSPPLYEAAIASSLIAVATLSGLISILLDRSRFLLRRDQVPLFEAMGGMEPGAFRRLMRLGRHRIVTSEEALTRQGVSPDRLYFVKSGQVLAEKGPHRFLLPAPLFIGEIAYMTEATASATIRVGPDAELVEWQHTTLRRATERNARLRLALDARLARDLADKVAKAVGPDAVLP
jgi:CRP-like cAMP-binding protein